MLSERPGSAPCPCGSGQKDRDCCLTRGHYFKAPADVNPTPPISGVVNPACYMSSTSDCSNDSEREHFFSESILRELSMGAKHVWAAGMHWMAPEVPERAATKGISARVLCGRHNRALGPLDAAAVGFFRTLREIRPTDGEEPPPTHSLYSGHDIERWLLKVMLGLATSGLARDQDGERCKTGKPPVVFARALLDPRWWPPGFGRLSVCPRPAVGLSTAAACRVELAAAGPEHVVGLRIVLWDTVLLIGTTPTSLTTRVVTRPPALITKGGSRVELSWLDFDPRCPTNEVWWPHDRVPGT